MNVELDKIIAEYKIIAILRGVTCKHAEKTVEALLKGGIKALEITLTTEDALDAIKLVCNSFGSDAIIGAGTVLTTEETERVCEAGGRFIVSPNTDVNVIQTAKSLGLSTFPGALTPTEIVTAVQAGSDYVKLFPAGNMGLGYFKALRGPLPDVPFIVTGGIDMNNLGDFLKAGAYGAGLGGSLVDVKRIENGDFEYITNAVKGYVDIVKGL